MSENISTNESKTVASNPAANSGAASMVEETKLLKVVKRLFTGSVSEVLSELIQNSQRAQARNLHISADGELLVITDDGTGLTAPDGSDAGDLAAMFSPLMRIAESSYESAEIEQQDPMGVGIFALLALDGVRQIVIKSRGAQMAIDTQKLWNEDGYWQSWRARVTPSDTHSRGVEMFITATPEVVKNFSEALRPTYNKYLSSENYTPASGYEGVLNIFLNGAPVDTSCHFTRKWDEPILETDYQGNRLLIGVSHHLSQNFINWYGQLIRADRSHINYYLEVRKNRPVSPMSPSRRGIIEDADYHNLLKFVREKVREHLLNSPQNALSEKIIRAVYGSDGAWANDFCPYLIASRAVHDPSNGSYENWVSLMTNTTEILKYADEPVLLNTDEVLVVETNIETGLLEAHNVSCGAKSFVPAVERVLGKNLYEILSGNPQRLQTLEVMWQPGEKSEEFFAEAGRFAILTKPPTEGERQPGQDFLEALRAREAAREKRALEAAIPPANSVEWHALSTETVFAFEYPENWDITSTEGLIVGVPGNRLDAKIDFLNTASWCVWSYEHDESDSETMSHSFDKSLDEVKAVLLKDCLPDDTFDLFRISFFFKLEPDERIRTLTFEYEDASQPVAAAPMATPALTLVEPVAVTEPAENIETAETSETTKTELPSAPTHLSLVPTAPAAAVAQPEQPALNRYHPSAVTVETNRQRTIRRRFLSSAEAAFHKKAA